MAKERGENKKGNGRKNANKQSPHSRSLTGKNKRCQAKLRSDSGIAKSKQLLNKLKTTRGNNSTRTTRSMSVGAPRVCGNGMPMPSLAELEQMYNDDSDDNENNNLTPTTAQSAETTDRESCKTPVHKPLVLTEDKLRSPTTLKVIASKMMDLISNLPIITIEDNCPPPPVIPPKKRKKPDKPYIVGCKDRPQVPWAPKTSFCKGDAKYGVEEHNENDDENSCPKKRRRLGTGNVSKSIFNAKSDEIASWLKQSEQSNKQIVMPGTGAEQCKRTTSSDSDTTVDYNVGAGSPQNVNRFSPLPSTSRDNDVFLRNDQLFNESLNSAIGNKTTDSDSEIEIVDAPVETVVIDDSLPVQKIEPINYTDEDCCVIVEPQSDVSKMDTSVINIDSPNDNGYGSFDFNLNLENSDCEIIDVDDVLTENQAIIAKYEKQDGLGSVTVVDPGRSYAPKLTNNSPPAPASGTSKLRGNNIIIQEPTMNTIDTQTESTGVIGIEDVVTNFFVNSNYGTSNVDLTEVSEIPRDWTTWISSLPTNNNSNLNGQNDQSAAPTVCHRSDPPSVVGAPAVSVSVSVNAPASNTLNLVITDLSHVSPNRVRRNKGPTRLPIPVMTPSPVEPQRNLASKNLGDCPICMESLGSSPIASTLCGHIFCMDCIKASIRTNGKRCPTCRKVLKANGYHQLFL